MTPAQLAELLRDSLRDPRGVARTLMLLNLPLNAVWTAAALMAVGSALLTHLGMGLMMPMDMGGAMVMPSPVFTALSQFIVLLLTAQLAAWLGRMAGGTGRFGAALLLVTWLQFVLLALQLLQLVLMAAIPPLGMLLGYASVVVFFWLLSAFVAELHGFRSTGLTFVGVLLATIAAAFLLALLLFPMMGA